MQKFLICFVMSTVVLAFFGCAQKPTEQANEKKNNGNGSQPAPSDSGHGWWCDEHGVIEEECSMCQKDVFKKLKPSDICTNHPDRAKSQCFICNPKLWEKSQAAYVAKYGKNPPTPKENMPGGQ